MELSLPSQIHTLLSRLQVANKLPPMAHDAHFTSFSCPSSVAVHSNSPPAQRSTCAIWYSDSRTSTSRSTSQINLFDPKCKPWHRSWSLLDSFHKATRQKNESFFDAIPRGQPCTPRSHLKRCYDTRISLNTSGHFWGKH